MKQNFKFDLGNSTDGQVGAVARVVAETKEEALAILRKALPIEVEVIRTGEHKQIEYLNVYFNDRTEDRAVSVKDIDEGDTQDVKEGEPY